MLETLVLLSYLILDLYFNTEFLIYSIIILIYLLFSFVAVSGNNCSQEVLQLRQEIEQLKLERQAKQLELDSKIKEGDQKVSLLISPKNETCFCFSIFNAVFLDVLLLFSFIKIQYMTSDPDY